jgi:glycine/D-amino acid oxidase-like deaminating enzyme
VSNSYDVVVIGAGSVGAPLAMSLAERKIKCLCIDKYASAGQGNNKCAIGGIRATHSEPAKVSLALHSLEVFRTWQELHGDDIGWRQGGYTYIAYDNEIAGLLKKMLPVQQAAGLNISWIDDAAMSELAPGINPDGLLGGTYSPEDGSASPMMSGYAFYSRATRLGAEFRFRESVTGINTENGRVVSVSTDKSEYACGAVINCAGSYAKQIGALIDLDLPVVPDCHESGITEPVKSFFKPMIVDLRCEPGSANYYFYQNDKGQVVFCMTPDPPVLGTSREETSTFLPLVAPRMINLYPRLANIKVRRTWMGNYPQSPDGSPIIDQVGPSNHYVAVGMCGQGYMLGPGVGALVARLIADDLSDQDRSTLHEFRLDRGFESKEALK